MISASALGKSVDFARLADKLHAVPGVGRVSLTDSLPLSGTGEVNKRISIPGVTTEPVEVGWKPAAADYFAIMGTRVLRGRDFDRRDPKGTAVVNETMARQFWGSPEAALGRIIKVDGADSQIQGVVENGIYRSLSEKPIPFLFVATPIAKGGEATLLIETAGSPTAMVGSIRKVIHDADPDAMILSLATLRQNMRLSLFPFQVGAGMVGTIGILAIFLAAVGLYGLVAYSVSRRTHEIGVRMAMGAGPADVLKLVFRETLSRLGIGAALGLAAGLAGAHVIRSALYGVSPTDPAGLAVALAVVAAVGLLAAYAPARRALHVDPATALRQE
jgi:ABC-type antimicrobial peptide transport system permease subunit